MPIITDVVKHITEKTVADFGVNGPVSPNPVEINTGFPKGDEGILALRIKWSGTFSTTGAAGAAVTDGALKIVRAIRFHVDTLGDVIRGVSARALSRMIQMRMGTRGVVVDCASNANGTTFSASLVIPFADRRNLQRSYDLLLDMKRSLADLKIQPGQVTDIQSGGANATVTGLRFDVSCDLIKDLDLPNPAATSLREKFGELPIGFPSWEPLARVDSVNGKIVIPVTTGEKYLRRLHFEQVTIDPTTGLVTEVSSIIGANSAITMKVGSDLYVDGVTFSELQMENKVSAQVEGTFPAGWAFIDFDKDKSVEKYLNLKRYQAGVDSKIEILDCTAVANGYILPYAEYADALPDGADRLKA